MAQPTASERGISNQPERIMHPDQLGPIDYLPVAHRTGGIITLATCRAITIRYPGLMGAFFQVHPDRGASLYYKGHRRTPTIIDTILLEEGELSSATFVGLEKDSNKVATKLKKVKISKGASEVDITETDLTDLQTITPLDKKLLAAVSGRSN